MRNVKFWIWVGIAIGAVWAFEGADGALIAAGLGAVGLLVGVLLQQGISLREVIRDSEEER